MNEIMKLEEVNLIGMLFQTCPPAQIESEVSKTSILLLPWAFHSILSLFQPIFFQFNDGNETDDAKLFVKTILFNLDIDTKIEELNQSEDAQVQHKCNGFDSPVQKNYLDSFSWVLKAFWTTFFNRLRGSARWKASTASSVICDLKSRLHRNIRDPSMRDNAWALSTKNWEKKMELLISKIIYSII